MFAVVFSVEDPAGRGIAEYVVKKLSLGKMCACNNCAVCYMHDKFILAGFREDVIEFDFLDNVMPSNISFYIVASRHSSEAEIKSFTVHFTGNYGEEAKYGGKPRELGIAHPQVGWFFLNALSRMARAFKKDFEVSYEATHHGPTSLSKPVIFVEIGSTSKEWEDPGNHAVVGSTLLEFVSAYPELPWCTPAIGIGGGHYPRKHTELALRSSICYGHILPKYALQYLTREILEMMRTRCLATISRIVVEKKGTRLEHRILVEEYAKSVNLEVEYI